MDRGSLEGLTAARVATNGQIKDVRGDHVARYQWAAARLEGRVIDAGCNCGYGSAILADAGLTVTGMDNWQTGLDYAQRHWDRPAITWNQVDFASNFSLPSADAVVAFEIIEHLEDPTILLDMAWFQADRLLASVPNEEVWPHEPRLYPVHQRHYTRDDFEDLLRSCGWDNIEWFGQRDGHSPVEPEMHGRTLVVDCR